MTPSLRSSICHGFSPKKTTTTKEREFPSGLWSGDVPAMAQFQSLAQELPHVVGAGNQKKRERERIKREKGREKRDTIGKPPGSMFIWKKKGSAGLSYWEGRLAYELMVSEWVSWRK